MHFFSLKNLFKVKANKVAQLWFVVVAAFLLVVPVVSKAALSLGLETVGSTGLGTTDNLKLTIINIIRYFLGFVGIIAVAIILYGGYTWMTSQGADDKIKKAKKIIINGVIGLVIIISAWLIVSFVLKMWSTVFGPEPNGGRREQEYSYGSLGGGILRDVYPLPGAQAVPRNTLVMATFNEKIALTSLIDHSSQPALCDGATYASNTCGYLAKSSDNEPNVEIAKKKDGVAMAYDRVVVMTNDGKTFVFKLLDLLGNPNSYTAYEIVLTPRIMRDRNGSPAFSTGGYVWPFTVSNILDVTPPQVVSVVPVQNETGVPKNSLIQINFSEPVNAITASGKVLLNNHDTSTATSTGDFDKMYVKYTHNGVSTFIAGEFAISNGFKTVEFTPLAKCLNAAGAPVQNSCGRNVFCLPGNENVTTTIVAASVSAGGVVDILSGVTDAAGNSLDGNKNGTSNGRPADNYIWGFLTNNTLDLIPPKVLPNSMEPEANGASIPRNTFIEVKFNKLMKSSSLVSDYFKVISDIGSCTSSSRIDPDEASTTLPFPPDGQTAVYGGKLAKCYPVGFVVGKEDFHEGNVTGTKAAMTLFNQLPPLQSFYNRLSDKMQDLRQNCFNPAQCSGNCPGVREEN